MNILALNPGSATLKFGAYQMANSAGTPYAADKAVILASGVVTQIGGPSAELTMTLPSHEERSETVAATTPSQLIDQIVRRLTVATQRANAPTMFDAVGCRVVHGGAKLTAPTLVTPAVLDELRELKDLAPLHVPADIAVLEQILRSLPAIPLVAVFDTSFHRTLPALASTYALPAELRERYSLRRYGFHGISHGYVSRRLLRCLACGIEGTRVITCHLGSGASVCAVRDGKSIDTSMGLTPMEGLVMSTRSGDVDPGLLLFLMRSAEMTAAGVDDLLNQKSGLLGLSGLSGDLRDVEQAASEGDTRAELALEIFAYRTCKYIGAYAAALGGLDAVAFTGGIGEHSASTRSRICRRLEFLGLRLEDSRNREAGAGDVRISADGSPVEVWVIPTDEQREIARLTHEEVRRG